MPVDLTKLRELAEKATKGLWQITRSPFDRGLWIVGNGEMVTGMITHAPNAAFIAAANPSTVLFLLAEIERKDKALAELLDIIEQGDTQEAWEMAKTRARAALSPATPEDADDAKHS